MTTIRYSLVAVDCPDPVRLAEFYARLAGLEVAPLDDEPELVEWVEVLDGDVSVLAFQRVPAYVAPVWPEGPVPQQLHLDFEVDDLDAGEAWAIALGAVKAEYQPGEDFRVFLDPAGHPFCLVAEG